MSTAPEHPAATLGDYLQKLKIFDLEQQYILRQRLPKNLQHFLLFVERNWLVACLAHLVQRHFNLEPPIEDTDLHWAAQGDDLLVSYVHGATLRVTRSDLEAYWEAHVPEKAVHWVSWSESDREDHYKLHRVPAPLVELRSEYRQHLAYQVLPLNNWHPEMHEARWQRLAAQVHELHLDDEG